MSLAGPSAPDRSPRRTSRALAPADPRRATGAGRRVAGSVVLGCVLLLEAVTAARPAVYRYVSGDGVESFTDCPVDPGGTLIVRDPRTGGASRVPAPAARRGAFDEGKPSTSPPGWEGVLPVDGVITSRYGPRHDPVDGLVRQHEGVDIAVPEGTPIRPVAPGRVVFSGLRSGYGHAVVVDHGAGRVTLYAHNAVNWVREGDRVAPGDILALSGSTGRSTGPHVHFAVWQDGVNVTGTVVPDPGARSRNAGDPADDVIRRIIQADGSLLFTNLPAGVR